MVSLSLGELDRRTQDLIEQVINSNEPALITDAEQPAAVVIPAQEYALQQQRLSLLERIARAKAELSVGHCHSQDEAEQLIDKWTSNGV